MVELSLASIVPAFLIGFASFFLSLCVLPLVPAFLAFLAGTSAEQAKHDRLKARAKILLNTFAFVLGLAFFFSLLGVLFQSILSGVANDVQIYLNYVFGVLIIIFGLMMAGLLNISFLQREYKLKLSNKGASLVSSFLFGAAFAVGWTPCATPFLGLVLGFAAQNPLQAFPILFFYSLGLGTPFVLTALFLTRSQKLFDSIVPHLKKLNFLFGLVFIILGILIFTGRLNGVVNALVPQDLALSIQGAQSTIFGSTP